MPTWKKRIEAVFSVVLPIGDGSGHSLMDPLEIVGNGADHPEDIIAKWLHYRSLLEEKEQTLIRKVYLRFDGKSLLRYDLRCCSHSLIEDVSRIEHLYFDLSSWRQQSIAETSADDIADKEALPQLFSGLQDYVDFYLDDDVLSRSSENHRFSLVLKRCPDGGRWALILEDLLLSKASGMFLIPFDPCPQQLHRFEEQCEQLAQQLGQFKSDRGIVYSAKM